MRGDVGRGEKDGSNNDQCKAISLDGGLTLAGAIPSTSMAVM